MNSKTAETKSPPVFESRQYRDRKGRVLFVHDGISGGKWWATYWRPRPWTLRRSRYPELAPRRTPVEAQRNLDAFASRNGLAEVGCRACGALPDSNARLCRDCATCDDDVPTTDN